MKKTEIQVGKTYSTKSGRVSRLVLDIQPQHGRLGRPNWSGAAHTAPGSDELLLEYRVTRGGDSTGVVFLGQFAQWADHAEEDVISSQEADALILRLFERNRHLEILIQRMNQSANPGSGSFDIEAALSSLKERCEK